MNKLWICTIAVLDAALILQLLQMSFAVLTDTYISGREKRILLIIGGLSLLLLIRGHIGFFIAQNIIDAGGRGELPRTILSVSGYVIGPVVIALFIYLFVLSVRSFNTRRRAGLVIPLFIAVIMAASLAADIFIKESLPVTFLTCAIISGGMFYYLWLHLKLAKEHETSLLAESRIQIMMSQIQPHFLYNTLASIQALCATDPPKAAHTVEIFANYLRQNLDSLGVSELIPLKKELEHTRIYTEIELLMFPEIVIDYQISDQSFGLPALTIQPLVENSIRHGVRGIKDPIIYIITRREEDHHVIIIKDNGRGFDTSDESKMSGKHIGIRNVRERIEKMCGGTVDVVSRPGEGCTVTIHIPVKKEITA